MNQAVPYQETSQFVRQRYEDTSLVIFHNHQRNKSREEIKPVQHTFPAGVTISPGESGGAGDAAVGNGSRSGVTPEGTSSRPDHQSGSKVCQVI